MLFLADVDGHVLVAVALADDHTGIDLHARPDEHRTAILHAADTIGGRFARFKRDERAGQTAGDLTLDGRVAVKRRGHDALASRVGQKFVAVAEQAARRDEEFQPHTAADRGHGDKVALALGDLIDHGADGIFRHVRDHALDRLAELAVNLLVQNVRRGDLELKALAAHGLHQDGQVQNAAARDLDAALVLELLDLHGHVVLGLVEQALLELTGTHDVAVAADERGGRSFIDDGQGRRVDLDGLELDGVLGIGVALITRTCGVPPFCAKLSLCFTPNLCCSSVITSDRLEKSAFSCMSA